MAERTKRDVVDLLEAMASAMRRAGDVPRWRAYSRAARSIAAEERFEDLLARKRLQDIPGVGPAIEKKVRAFMEKGEKPEWIEDAGKAPPAQPKNKVRPRVELAIPARIARSYREAPFPEAPDLHCHTTWSDGTLTIREAAEFARRLGAKALGISDHSGSLRVANGLRPADVLAQWEEIDRVQEELPDLRILKGTECDILRDGTLDHPEHLLTGFDYVIGSLHSQLKLPLREQTERVLAALEQPHLTILGHPTTAVPGRRAPANLDLGRVFEKAAERGVALEVNGNPGRLDLPVPLIRKALDAGCRLSLGSDGHSASEMLSLEAARRMAHEAGATEDDLVNLRFVRGAPAARPERARPARRG